MPEETKKLIVWTNPKNKCLHFLDVLQAFIQQEKVPTGTSNLKYDFCDF